MDVGSRFLFWAKDLVVMFNLMAINIGMYSYQYPVIQGSATSRRIVYTYTAHGLTTDAYITHHSG